MGFRISLHYYAVLKCFIKKSKIDLAVCSVATLIMKVTNTMQLYRLIYFSLLALHVSGDVFAHHQEHLTIFTVFGSIHPGCCRLAAGSNLREYYQIL